VREAIRAAGGDQQQDAIGLLVDHVRATTYDKLPDEAIEATKKSVLDSIATTIAGYHAERCQEVRQYLSDIGGRADSRIVFQDGRVPAHHAVLANIMMCHALELDDLYDDAVAHASTPAVWSAFAIVDKQGGCSGKEFLTAVMLGADVKCRIAAAASRTFSNGHHNSLLAGFAAVAAAGKLANADAEVMWNAFGLALSQAAASVQALPDGALVKRLQPALNAADGLRSLDLAGNGVTGVRNVLEGQFGFCNLFHHASCAREILTDQLGIRFLGADSSIKRYPSSRCTHGPIQAVLQLIKDRPIAITEIDTIEVKVSATCVEVAGAPWASAKGSPQVNAQFNIPYCVAAALVWQDFFVPQIDDLIDDPRVKALATRVKVGVVPEGRDRMTFAPVELTIRMRQGETIEYRVEALKGSPQDPMSWNEIIDERVKRCVAYSGNIVPAANVATLIDLVRNLEHVQDVREILDLLAQAAPRH